MSDTKHENAIAEFKGKIASLEAAVAKLTEENKQLSIANANLKADREELSRKSGEVEARFSAVSKENARLLGASKDGQFAPDIEKEIRERMDLAKGALTREQAIAATLAQRENDRATAEADTKAAEVEALAEARATAAKAAATEKLAAEKAKTPVPIVTTGSGKPVA